MKQKYEIFVKTYPWKWVCVQHPMILISDDWSEPRALETVPPWGANDIPGYCHKMFEMLKKLEDNPEVKVDFDLSAKELLLFLENEPDGKALLKKLIASGQVGFVGVDYAQTHYATARSESALRGIRMGAEIYKKELGVVSDTFQHQEIGIFQNLPQILKAYGVRKATTFRFPTVMEFTEGAPELLSQFGKLSFMHHSSMARWQGLDGTEIPTYLPWIQTTLDTDFEADRVIYDYLRPEFQEGRKAFSPARTANPTFAEENKGLCRSGSIIMQCPDMVEISDEYIANRQKVGTFWRLSEAIDEEMKVTQDMPRMRYTSYWSYAEGRFGERMYKAYRKCEAAILAAETMQTITGGVAGAFDAESAWDKLLSSQHHDVNWLDTRDLCTRAEGWAMQAKADAEAYQQKAAALLAEKGQTQDAALVFNTLPAQRNELVSLPTESACRVFDGEKELDAQWDDGQLVFEAQSEGLGYRSYSLQKAEASPVVPETVTEPYHFENDSFSVEILPDGRISSLRSKRSGERLRSCGNVLGGLLWKESGERVVISNENTGRQMQVTKGKLYDKVTISGQMEEIPYEMVIRLPHGDSREIRFNLALTFDKTAIGDCVHDESKLNLYWPLRQTKSEVWIDEPFGVTKAHLNRPLVASNFVSVFDQGCGVTLFHEGTPKVWMEDGTLVNQLAWGGDMITNRDQCEWFGWSGLGIFDMRLEGTLHYAYTMRIEEEADPAAVAAYASRRITPMPVVRSERALPETTLLSIQNPNWITTAVEERNGSYVVRGWESDGKETELELNGPWKLENRTDVAGHLVEGTIHPYEVTELHFSKH